MIKLCTLQLYINITHYPRHTYIPCHELKHITSDTLAIYAVTNVCTDSCYIYVAYV